MQRQFNIYIVIYIYYLDNNHTINYKIFKQYVYNIYTKKLKKCLYIIHV